MHHVLKLADLVKILPLSHKFKQKKEIHTSKHGTQTKWEMTSKRGQNYSANCNTYLIDSEF